MTKPAHCTFTFFATTKLNELQRPYRRFTSYPVYILRTEGGDFNGCALTDVTEIGKEPEDADGVKEIESDEVYRNDDELTTDVIPEVDLYSTLPDIM